MVIALLLRLVGVDPTVAYATMLSASLGSAGAIGQTLNKATPLVLSALGVAFAMRAGLLNVGIDGQLYLGAIAATGAAFFLGPRVAPALGVPVVLLAGVLGGAVAAAPAALFRAAWGVNEIFVTVMLNFVFFQLTDYLATGPWNDPLAGEAITRPIPPPTYLPPLGVFSGAHSGIVLALLLAVVVALVLGRTRLGFEIRAVGDNPRAARLGGIDVRRTIVVALLASGAFGGLAGAIEIAGYHQRLIDGISPGYGYMAVLLAVLGKQRPFGATLAAFGFALLLVGSDSLQRSVRLPQSAVLVFEAAVLLAVLLVEAWRRRGWA
jgi:general nucleoside transport system permease protein